MAKRSHHSIGSRRPNSTGSARSYQERTRPIPSEHMIWLDVARAVGKGFGPKSRNESERWASQFHESDQTSLVMMDCAAKVCEIYLKTLQDTAATYDRDSVGSTVTEP